LGWFNKTEEYLEAAMLTVKDLLLDHLEQTYKHEGWYPPLGMAVKGLTAGQAAWKPSPERHSIWQIVRHVIRWKRGALQSWAGDPPDYEMMTRGDWQEVNGDQVAWDLDVRTLNELYDEFHRRLDTVADEDVQGSFKAYQQSPRPTQIAKRLSAVFTHDAYHAGQIQYLRALQGIPADRFFNAAWSGDVEKMKEVLSSHPDLLNSFGRDGWTALHLAAYTGHTDAANALLSWGADVHAISENSLAQSCLHAAIAGKRAVIVPLLLDHGADPEATDSGGNTALHLAAHEGVPEIVETLLQRHVNVNPRRSDRKTPLAVGVAEGKTQVADLLRRRGATE
jgi:uncharacterized damage-inducible protein DinB